MIFYFKASLEPNFITKSNGSRCISKSREWTKFGRERIKGKNDKVGEGRGGMIKGG